jgi:molybdopterin converting factor small subunit
MDPSLTLFDLAADPLEEWRRMVRFVNLGQDDLLAMSRTSEILLGRAREFVVSTYDYLRSVPETAAILGWVTEVDENHLEERRRFFTIWLARTLGLDTSDEFANYLFQAGKFHAGHGPRAIHTPSAYVTTSIGLVLAAFARYLSEANCPAEALAQAMAGWSKYLNLQLNQMLFGYQIAVDYERGDFPVHFSTFGRMRNIVGKREFDINAERDANIGDMLRKFFNYYPQARADALDRSWQSEEKDDSLWVEVEPVYVPKKGWRILLNGRDVSFEGGFKMSVHPKDKIAIFPPGR